ncbi:hypothetical protein DAD186_03630 [Dermabacter vaginalis]|uniref:Uncharacterized protein n=1 Tax=Dermabacter vaginalis TaxID=1630135 RepID=A0A1B0ZG50_9MICO|nr:hypothetical protein DAD186_03630 [Dermabacter vaginalis]
MARDSTCFARVIETQRSCSPLSLSQVSAGQALACAGALGTLRVRFAKNTPRSSKKLKKRGE